MTVHHPSTTNNVFLSYSVAINLWKRYRYQPILAPKRLFGRVLIGGRDGIG